MFTKQEVGAALFTLLCLGLATKEYYRDKPFDTQLIQLVLLAAVPWALPWLSTLLKSLKVGGMELDFRDLAAKVEENREATKALASGVGMAGAIQIPSTTQPDGFQGKSLGTAEAGDFGGSESDTPAPYPDFGNNPVAGSRSLSATVKPFLGSDELFMIHAWVESTDLSRPLPDGTPVIFHLPAFNPPVVVIKSVGGVAAIDRVTRGSFTVGAEVDGVRLGLPLQTVSGAPERFRSR